jgi:hypothetical protein
LLSYNLPHITTGFAKKCTFIHSSSYIYEKILLFYPVLFFSCNAWCQTFSYGFRAGYVTYHRLYVNSNIEGTSIRGSQKGSNNFIDGLRFAVLTRAEHKRWSGQAELAYAYHIGGIIYSIDNWNNPSNTERIENWEIGTGSRLKQTELNLSAGYKPLKWIRLFAGLGIWNVTYKNKENLVLYDETLPGFEDVSRFRNEMNRFRYGIQESYLPWILTRQLGIGFDIKRNFSLDIAYDRNLTSVSKEIKYKDGNYVFKQRSDRFVVSLGYRFYQLKFKNALPREK